MDYNDEIVPEEEVSSKRKTGKTKRMRNLTQYRDLSDEEFDKAMEKTTIGGPTSQKFEERIEAKLEEFERDYDLSDLKINDRDTLRALIQAQLTLEDYEQHLYKLRQDGISETSLFSVEKFQKAMSDIRGDISKLQNDLNITRKIRKSDRDVSVMAYIDGLKQKAKKFYESKMSYIFCEKCNMLIGTIWTLFPDEDRSKIALICQRDMGDGTKCGHKTVVGTKELLKNRGTNKKEITPESML